MTLDTITVSRYVVSWLSSCGRTVMTGSAIVGYALMIKRGASKSRGVMTHATIFRSWNVSRAYFGILSGRVSPVMTGIATCGPAYVTVVEYGGHPGNASGVAKFAVVSISGAVRGTCCINTFSCCRVMTS